jgi:hypothetical protein
MEISLPNETGRKEILKIHTQLMKQFGKMADDVYLDVSNIDLHITFAFGLCLTVIISMVSGISRSNEELQWG